MALTPDRTRCDVRAWRPQVPGVVEVFHARMTEYSYPRHCHDHWTVLIVDDGGIGYDLDDRSTQADVATIGVLPPHVMHDGHALGDSFRKRVVYLDSTWLPDDLIGAAVDRSNVRDRGLYDTLDRAHRALLGGDDLAAEAAIAFAADSIRSTLGQQAATPLLEVAIARRFKQYLDEHQFESVTLVQAADALERNVTHVARSFTAAYGMSPHAYLTGRRVDAARRLLLDGMGPAEVAAAVGFHDQSHLTRHFRRHTSTTPGRYARSAA